MRTTMVMMRTIINDFDNDGDENDEDDVDENGDDEDNYQ